MKGLFRGLWPNARWAGAGLCAIGALHILETLATPYLLPAQAYNSLTAGAAVNTMTLLPPVSPTAQKVPFMSADASYAICPFDTQKGAVAVTASLPAPGWALALYSPEGENFYVAVAQPGRPTSVSLLLVAPDDRFTGLTPQAQGLSAKDAAQLKVPASQGFVLLKAPDQGQAYKRQSQATLQAARCSAQAQ